MGSKSSSRWPKGLSDAQIKELTEKAGKLPKLPDKLKPKLGGTPKTDARWFAGRVDLN